MLLLKLSNYINIFPKTMLILSKVGCWKASFNMHLPVLLKMIAEREKLKTPSKDQ